MNNVVCAADSDPDAGAAEDRFENAPAPANAALHRYINDLAHVRVELAILQLQVPEDADADVMVQSSGCALRRCSRRR
jgi:hypothetical protein